MHMATYSGHMTVYSTINERPKRDYNRNDKVPVYHNRSNYMLHHIDPGPFFASINLYLSRSFRSLRTNAMHSSNAAWTPRSDPNVRGYSRYRIKSGKGYEPTIPNKLPMIISRYLFTKLENGPTQPFFCAAIRNVGHVASISNGGSMLSKYPQQSHYGHPVRINTPLIHCTFNVGGILHLFLQQAPHA